MAAKLRDAVYSCRSDKWVTLPTTRRRLQEWGGRPGASDVTVKGPFPLPTYQLQLAQRLVQLYHFQTKHWTTQTTRTTTTFSVHKYTRKQPKKQTEHNS